MSRFDGKVAVITGGASGIGRTTAEKLVAEGAHVVLFDLKDAEAAAAELGDAAAGQTVDVADAAALEDALQTVVDQFGGLHHLVNNAGVDGEVTPIGEYSVEAFDTTVAVNLRGVFLGMRFGIPHMLASGGGSIVNIASAAAVRGVPGLAPYSATKAGVVALTRTAAVEYSGQGIRVNAVLPGAIETPLLSNVFAQAPDIKAAMLAQHPIGRFGTTAELAATILFLASDDAGFISGAALSADGGFAAV